jgi:lariat debranching enzyme
MHCPEKYKQMGCFHDYYEGRKKAGLLTVMIGGNHEAVNSLR